MTFDSSVFHSLLTFDSSCGEIGSSSLVRPTSGSNALFVEQADMKFHYPKVKVSVWLNHERFGSGAL
ncbi:MAG: hypothetical protein JWL86_7030 [Rhizobium sp.]|nr:hypothetical protein [Rhizobium sp.]